MDQAIKRSVFAKNLTGVHQYMRVSPTVKVLDAYLYYT